MSTLDEVRAEVWSHWPERWRHACPDFDQWVLAEVVRRVYKGGMYWFDKGEVTLTAPAGTDDGRRETYSMRQRLVTTLKPEDVRAL